MRINRDLSLGYPFVRRAPQRDTESIHLFLRSEKMGHPALPTAARIRVGLGQPVSEADSTRYAGGTESDVDIGSHGEGLTVRIDGRFESPALDGLNGLV